MNNPPWIDVDETNIQKRTKNCFVPTCKNNSLNQPSKHLFPLPPKQTSRAEWYRAVGRATVHGRQNQFICEDHLNLEHALENYVEWTLYKCKPKLKQRVPFLKNLSQSQPKPDAGTSRWEIKEDLSPFDYPRQCIICGNDASEDFIQGQRKKYVVHRFTRQMTAKNMYRTMLNCSEPDIIQIKKRIEDKDLIALNARYHIQCYIRLQYRCKNRPGSQDCLEHSKPPGEMDKVYQHVRDNHEDSQFSLPDLHRVTGVALSGKIIVKNLQKYYDIAKIKNKNVLLTQKEFLMKDWHEHKLEDEKSERLRIVQAAANIVLEDIRSVLFDNRCYPPPSNFLEDVSAVIPETLSAFVDTMTKYTKNAGEKIALGHSIMTAARPRTFKSPLLLGLGSFINQKRDPKNIINLLSSIGFCASYEDVSKLEMSIAHHDKMTTEAEFTQFVYDVLDANTEGYSGPALVGVQCDIPTSILHDAPVLRRETVPTEAAPLDTVVLHKCPVSPSLRNVVLEDLGDDTPVLPTRGDALWLLGKEDSLLDLPPWDEFMAKMQTDRQSCVAEIRALPVIHTPPTDHAIYTALRQAQSRTGPGATCLVTFDQPLYLKAQAIVKSNSEMSNVVLRLGGFHLMTAFLDAIGRIMAGSGLRELWGSALPAGQAAAALAGTDYTTAVRAHLLTRSALFGIITKDFNLTAEERSEIEGIIDGKIPDIPQSDSQKTYQDPLAITETNQGVKQDRESLARTLKLLEKRGPTAKLWVQYFRMSTLAARLAEAERGADWALHLSTLAHMLPYLLAAGNMEYAKSCSLYLQKMRALETKMSAEEYEAFTKKGYFTVRRTDKHWADVWSDRVVEETMSTIINTPSAAVRGANVTDCMLARIHSTGPSLSTISDVIEDFCRPERNSEEDKERNNEEIRKFRAWFANHDPFVKMEHVVSIGTGISGGKGVNCHEAEEVGKRMMAEKVGENFEDLEYSGDDCVTLSLCTSVINIDGYKTPIGPDTILKRIKITEKNEEKLRSYFKYEFAPYPLSLFDERGMLEPDKSALFDLFVPVEIPEAEDNRRLHVIDGEFLLHKILWKEGIAAYTEYVKTNFPNAIIVFVQQQRSKGMMMSRNRVKTRAATAGQDTLKTSQEIFLSNENRREKFIEELTLHFVSAGITVKSLICDIDEAHSYIVKTAGEKCETYDDACVVSDDADLLVHMCARGHKDVYFMKPGNDKNATYYHTQSFSSPQVELGILFLHAISGCNTTSAIFRKGKAEVAALINSMRPTEVSLLMSIFKNPNASPIAVASKGEWFMQTLYGCTDLNEKRFEGFSNSLTRSTFDLACLPPTSAACIQHAYRTYHRVQKWLGNDLPATDWGWELVDDRLEPVTTLAELGPKKILDVVSCKCKSICISNCVCKRLGLDCCVLCINCRGNACHGVTIDTYEYDIYGLSAPDNLESENLDNSEDESMPDELEHLELQPTSSKRLKRNTVEEELRSGCEMEQVYIVEHIDLT